MGAHVRVVAFREQLKSLAGAIVLFGTGHGLATSIVEGADVVLEPLKGRPEVNNGYNHLSVRTAASIFLDRLLG